MYLLLHTVVIHSRHAHAVYWAMNHFMLISISMKLTFNAKEYYKLSITAFAQNT